MTRKVAGALLLILFVAGCALIYVPAAFLVAGGAVVVACERWSIAENAQRR